MGEAAAVVEYLGGSLKVVDLRPTSEFFCGASLENFGTQTTLGKTQTYGAETFSAPESLVPVTTAWIA
jgi:hypothetical protein